MPRRRENTVARRHRTLVPRSQVLVVCGAARTEGAYLKGLRGAVANRAVDITLVRRPRDPRSVVEYAITYATAAARDFDEVWCVFDVDEFDIASAVTSAEAAAVIPVRASGGSWRGSPKIHE